MGLFSRFDHFAPLPPFVLAMTLFSGCAVVGTPVHPQVTVSASSHWHALLPHGGSAVQLADWWRQFDDPILVELMETAAASHPNLHRALAAIQEARATLVLHQADGRPRVDGSAATLRSGNRNDPTPATGSSVMPEATVYTTALDAKWELDLFGGLQQATAAATARLTEREDNWHDARVSLAAEVANRYVGYRACRQLQAVSLRELSSRQETEQVTDKAVSAGLMPPIDHHLAGAKRSEAAAALTAQQATCDLTVKALVSLTGLEEPALRTLLHAEPETIPHPATFEVHSLPADLLAQRPDLVAMERALAAASADVGVAEANRYPRLTLLGNLSLSTLDMTHAALTSQPWSLGPSLMLPLLDGGARSAKVEEARGRYEQAYARYLGAIRTAVEEVETALVNLDSIRRRALEAQATTAHYQAYCQATEALYRAGGSSLLTREEAQRTALNAERTEIALQRDQVLAWITLYKALGGGWQTTAPSTLKEGES